MKYYLNLETEEISTIEELYNGLHFEILNNLNSDEEFPTLEQFEKDLDCAIYQGACEYIQLDNIFKLDCFNLPSYVYDELTFKLTIEKQNNGEEREVTTIYESIAGDEVYNFYNSYSWVLDDFNCLQKTAFCGGSFNMIDLCNDDEVVEVFHNLNEAIKHFNNYLVDEVIEPINSNDFDEVNVRFEGVGYWLEKC